MSDEPQGTPEGAAAPPPAPEAPPTAPPTAPPPAAGGIDTDDTGKMLAALGYIFGVIAVVLLLIDPYKESKFVRQHSLQAIALLIGYFIASVIVAIPVVGWILSPIMYIAFFIFSIMGLVKAFQSEYWEMPGIYGMIQQYI